jgi:hypothetical protein
MTLTDTSAGLLANEDMKAHYLGSHAHVKEARQRRAQSGHMGARLTGK